MSRIATTKEGVSKAYSQMAQKAAIVGKRLKRKLTLAEKILFGHLRDPEHQELNAGESILALDPDRVCMQDATAQMAILQYLSANRTQTAIPTTVHCDHLIRAEAGAKADMKTATDENREVYDFLETACAKAGIGFWKPGAGIIHQVVLEKYAFPGALIIGTDSHTPNGGGLGMLAIGVGGADAVDAMAGLAWEVKYPKIVGVKLTGKIQGWTAPKDVILKLLEILTVKGGTNRIIEYFGPGARSISCTGKATITNMGAELGATTSVFPFDTFMVRYLKATERSDLAAIAEKNQAWLCADEEVEQNPEKYFEKVVEIDLSTLEPQITGPHSPDACRAISKLAGDLKSKGWPDTLSAILIGSCTNSSYEDICRAADIAKQAVDAGIKMPVPFLVTPGSDQVFQTIQRDGQMATLEKVGGQVLANACGPCIGQWKRKDIRPGETNSILSSFNRNFPARNDGNPETLSFIGSPETVVAIGLGGKLSFNPLKDPLTAPDGKKVMLKAPGQAPDIPEKGFVVSSAGYVEPPKEGAGVDVRVDPKSKRLQILQPFTKWDGKDFVRFPLLLKAKGKCTTDHISPAGVWLKFRGHLDNISDNMFTGAVNAFTGEIGKGLNQVSSKSGETFPQIARSYKTQNQRWVVVGDENYGEGSSREHAAMEPRHLGGAAVIAKSFARIHETNLKKQGLLPLTFKNASDYDKVLEKDRISLLDLKNLKPKSEVTAVLHHADGKEEKMALFHSFTSEQLEWFRAGSALNLLSGH